jgi:ABC-type branched-subunit amino acid transport system permease subunit
MKHAIFVGAGAFAAYWLYVQATTGGDISRKPNGETGATVAAIGAALVALAHKQ